jgi:hypothetical protein
VGVVVDRFSIPLSNGRSLTLLSEQLRRVARGLGDESLALVADNDQEEPPIVAALRALPAMQRSDALNVVLRRFSDKQDVETIAQISGLNSWMVWQLEEAFRQALASVRGTRPAMARTTVAVSAG